jgi:hypothetical protein
VKSLPPRSQKPASLRIVLAAAASAAALSAIAAELPERQRLLDLLIGSEGPIVRVAVLCRTRCDITASEDPETIGSFRIEGVQKDLDIDLTGHGGVAERLRLKPANGGSLLTVVAPARLNAARVIDCETDSGPARCVEFRFERLTPAIAAPEPLTQPSVADARAAGVAASVPKPAPKRAQPPAPVRDSAPAPGLRSEATPPDPIPFLGAAIVEIEPTIRDADDARLAIPEFAPPERLAPPPPSREIETKLKERMLAPALEPAPRFDLAREMQLILGKTNDPATCEGASARLTADAWALGAMVDLAFCKAASGAVEEADDDFTRLLAYTPDNHEALVGRGLIALARGDRTRGLDFLQEALNALPPIAESDRIVAAMARY